MRSLYLEEVTGKDELEIFKKYGKFCGTTDYAIYLRVRTGHYDIYGNEYSKFHSEEGQRCYAILSTDIERSGLLNDYPIAYNIPEAERHNRKLFGYTNNLPPIYERSSSYLLENESEEDKYKVYSIDFRGGICSEYFSSYYYHGIRPVTTLKELQEITSINWINEELLLAGEFPNHHITFSYSSYPEKTNKEYFINSYSLEEKDPRRLPFKVVGLHENIIEDGVYYDRNYVINGMVYKNIKNKKIVRLKLSNYYIYRIGTPTLSDGIISEDVLGNYHNEDFLVEPIEWLYDKKTGLVVSTRTIIGGIPHKDMHKYLNKYFIEEIIPSKVKKYK